MDASYNFEKRRDGWREWFEFARLHPDTLGAKVAAEVRLQHGPYPVYWHLDVAPRELARGRYTVSDAPPESSA